MSDEETAQQGAPPGVRATRTLPLTMVQEPLRPARRLQPEAVKELAESMAAIGLKTPITVRKAMRYRDQIPTEVWEIVAGRHRAAAARRLGWTEIEAIVSTGDPASDRLWEISENLHRADLDPIERAEHITKWIELTTEKTVVASCDGSLSDGRRAGPQHQPRGVNAVARALGISKDEAHRAVKISGLDPAAKQLAKELWPRGNKAALLEAAREADPDAQVAALHRISRDRERTAGTEREAQAPAPQPDPAPPEPPQQAAQAGERQARSRPLRLELVRAARGDKPALRRGAVSGLVNSIREVGVQRPIVVRAAVRTQAGSPAEVWEIVDGHHRVAAARKIGLDEIEAIVRASDVPDGQELESEEFREARLERIADCIIDRLACASLPEVRAVLDQPRDREALLRLMGKALAYHLDEDSADEAEGTP